MSSSSSEETEMLLRSTEASWDSIESIFNQKLSMLTKSDSWFNMTSRFSPAITFSELQLREIRVKNLSEKSSNWEAFNGATWLPKTIQTKSLLKDELEILKVNMSINDNLVPLRRSQMLNRLKMQAKFRKSKKIKKCKKRPVSCFNQNEVPNTNELINEIEKSESAKTDKTAWKFLKRGSVFRKEYINSRKLALEILVLQPPASRRERTFLLLKKNLVCVWETSRCIISGFDFQPDSRFQDNQPVKITCPNCLFFVTTTVKQIKTIRFKFISAILTVVGCVFPNVFYIFRDTVHLCPLCKIYLGFCPIFYVRAKKKKLKSLHLNFLRFIKTNNNKTVREKKINVKGKTVREKKIKEKPPVDSKMVSASSTSAKNLFVEFKLRLSDRVQVNVNNIAAITRQIQRGSKSNENLMTAAKNFAIQEAAIENSETNLKKLKLLTTHMNNQLDSLHSNAMKMELVLEQVRSMQR